MTRCRTVHWWLYWRRSAGAVRTRSLSLCNWRRPTYRSPSPNGYAHGLMACNVSLLRCCVSDSLCLAEIGVQFPAALFFKISRDVNMPLHFMINSFECFGLCVGSFQFSIWITLDGLSRVQGYSAKEYWSWWRSRILWSDTLHSIIPDTNITKTDTPHNQIHTT